MKLARPFLITAAVIAPVVCPAQSARRNPPSTNDIEGSLKQLVNVYATVAAQAADPVDSSKAFYEGAMPGMLHRLDPHSVFFDPGQYEQLQQMEKSEQKGFGTIVSLLPGRVIVLQVMQNTPSARAGINPGDEVLAINGIALSQLDLEQLQQLLGQSRQMKVRLDVRRPGNTRLLQFFLEPETVDSPSVDRAFLLEPGIAFIRVTSFEEKTAKLVKEQIEKLGGRNLKGLILDLRNNPGGLLPAALEISSYFLQPGQTVLSVRGRSVQGEEAKVPSDAKPYSFPVAILINGKSASASEIVTGALQDHDRATVVGEPSFGKGLVQSVFPLSQGTAVALTTAFYYTPSGRSIQKQLRSGALEQATSATRLEANKEYKTDKGRIVRGGGGILPDELVLPEGMTPLRAVIEATAMFPNFATEYISKARNIGPEMEITPAALDEFQSVLSQHNIRPSLSEWSLEREWIRSRLKQEILNQALGVEKGDEVEAHRDPQVRAALRALTK